MRCTRPAPPGFTCDFEDGHPGLCRVTVNLTDSVIGHVGPIIDEHITELERQTRRLIVTRRWMLGAVAANIGAMLFNLGGLLERMLS